MMHNGSVLPVEGGSEATNHAKDGDEQSGEYCLIGDVLHGFLGFGFGCVGGILADESGVRRKIHGIKD